MDHSRSAEDIQEKPILKLGLVLQSTSAYLP